jgi:DNA modification methylase
MMHHGDCLDILPLLDAESVDSVVCDPPYGLSKEPDIAEVLRHWLAGDDYKHNSAGFMGNTWDSFVPGPSIWREVFRVLKPGGYVLAFFGTRTYDMGATAMRLAGFEVRDQVDWIFGSGFPKSHNIALDYEKELCERRDVGGGKKEWFYCGTDEVMRRTAPFRSDLANLWDGWGTALKPAHEPIVVARKPLIGTVAENVLRYGTGGLNIDGCRVPSEGGAHRVGEASQERRYADRGATNFAATPGPRGGDPDGRWPANIIHDGSDEVLAAFPDAKGQQGAVGPALGVKTAENVYGDFGPRPEHLPRLEIEKSAARFFYCAKASKADRNDGLEHFIEHPSAASEFRPNHTEKAAQGDDGNPYGRWKPLKNNHPTVKPTDLMRYLCRLVTPPGGTVLDPFAGSGSTGRAAVLEGFDFIGIEMDERFVQIAEARIAAAEKKALEALYE